MANGIAHKHLYPIRTDCPKECYKVLVMDGEGSYSTISHPTIVPADVVRGKRPWVAEEKGVVKTCFYNGMSRWIEGGFIHSYVSLERVKKISDYQKSLGKDVHIFKCEIPINMEYYDCEFQEYMSSQINFLSEIMDL